MYGTYSFLTRSRNSGRVERSEFVVGIVEGDRRDTVTVLVEESLKSLLRFECRTRVQVGMSKVLQFFPASRQSRTGDRFALQNIGRIRIERDTIEIGMRVGVISQFRTRVQPHVQNFAETVVPQLMPALIDESDDGNGRIAKRLKQLPCHVADCGKVRRPRVPTAR
jgi:hypothetical protein